MAINFDKALGLHEEALQLRSKRAEILANNIANAETPNFPARDVDFHATLAGEMSVNTPLTLSKTDAGHQTGLINPDFAAELMYRTPMQPAVDGNTVDIQEEMARYTENSLGFQTSFDLLNRKFKGLVTAIKGE